MTEDARLGNGVFKRRVEEVTQLDRVRNEDVKRALKQDVVIDVVKAKQNDRSWSRWMM